MDTFGIKNQIDSYALRLNNRISVKVDWKPKVSKPISQKEISLLHKKLISRSISLSRAMSNGGIAISISVSSINKTKPRITKLAKTIVDVFRKIPSEKSKNGGAPFLEDNKIKYVSVKYSPESFSNNINVEIIPFNDFIKDLEFANKILSGHYDDSLDFITLKKKIGEEYFDANQEKRRSEYLELMKNREYNIEIFGEDLYSDMIRAMRMAVQDEFIVNERPKLFYLYYYLLSKGYLEETWQDYTTPIEFKNSQSFPKWLSKVPLYSKLPSLPLDNQGSKKFISLVRRSLMEFSEHNEILSPIYSPIFLDVIYKPAENNNSNCTDLDSLMKLIIPEFNRVFKYEETPKIKREREFFKTNNQSKYKIHPVVGYNSFEIPRINNSEEGFLIVSISRSNINTESIRERIDKVINNAISCNLTGRSILVDQ